VLVHVVDIANEDAARRFNTRLQRKDRFLELNGLPLGPYRTAMAVAKFVGLEHQISFSRLMLQAPWYYRDFRMPCILYRSYNEEGALKVHVHANADALQRFMYILNIHKDPEWYERL
jgi:hypothetical protein